MEIEWIDSETLTAENYVEILSGASSEARLSLQAQPEGQDAGETRGPQERARGAIDGIIVPGGFGSRGIEGMILAAEDDDGRLSLVTTEKEMKAGAEIH